MNTHRCREVAASDSRSEPFRARWRWFGMGMKQSEYGKGDAGRLRPHIQVEALE